MRALCRRTLLLSRRLLSQTVSLLPLLDALDIVRRLLSQAAALHPVLPHSVVRRRLLPKTAAAALLARESAFLSLPAAAVCQSRGR